MLLSIGKQKAHAEQNARRRPQASAQQGTQLSGYFHLKASPSLALVSPGGSKIVATRLRSETGFWDRTLSMPPERAFLILVPLHPAAAGGYEMWIDGGHTRVDAWSAGRIGIYSLESNPIWRISGAFDAVCFHVPHSMLWQFTEENDLARVDLLECPQGTVDPVLYQMAQVILPAITKPDVFNDLFLEQIRLMLCAHLVQRYGVRAPGTIRFRGGLAPWQKRRVTEMMQMECEGELRLARLAGECGLSISHFARSFKRSFGVTVHRYLLAQRVERAKTLLAQSSRPLPQVALESGFGDQSAFNRAFSSVVGTSPGRWRRERAQTSPRHDPGPRVPIPSALFPHCETRWEALAQEH
ncbi:AraC family transcriptional regulator [Granulicella sibirica]|nr:AraC family transcriptional regulator [Granulicella sibirica]